MLILGFVISIITFPGIIVHELAHQIFCRLLKCAVFEVCYFRIGSPSGYVIYEAPERVSFRFWIVAGPFLVNTLIGAVISSVAIIPLISFGSMREINNYFLVWLGVSILMHSFPDRQEAKLLWDALRRERIPIVCKILMTPIVGVICVMSLQSEFLLNFLYGINVAILMPNIIIYLLAK